MTTGIVIFARMDSSRLPGKALKPLAGRPMLHWTIERCRMADADTPVFLATSDRTLDDPIARLAEQASLTVLRGDAVDVLGRAQAATEVFGLESLVRISGDSPFIAPNLIAHVLAVHAAEKPDLTTNVHPRTLPPGISAEAITRAALGRLVAATTDAADREHVTRHAYANVDAFRIVNVTANELGYETMNKGGLHLAVDTPEDYARACWIAERLPDIGADLNEIIRLARIYDDARIDLKETVS